MLLLSLEYQKNQHQRSVETLGLSGNGDTVSIAKNTKKVNTRPSSIRKGSHE